MQMLPHYFDNSGPGAAMAVAVDGEPPAIECRGLADIGCKQRITPETVFELASASKIFTAAATLLLVEDGLLDLSSYLAEHLPGLEAGTARPVTVRDLLQHTSGLPDYLASGIQTPLAEMTRESVMNRLPEWVAKARPGKEHAYSNTNYVVLAKLVEALSELSFPQFVATRLVKPFTLRSTGLATMASPDLEIARGYVNRGFGWPHFEPVEDPGIDTDGDGGVYSCLRDLLRWSSLFWEGKIVSPHSLQLMATPGKLDSGARFDYGLGLQIEGPPHGPRWVGHGGSWINTTTLVGRYVETGTTIIVLSNELMAPVERLSQRAAAVRSLI